MVSSGECKGDRASAVRLGQDMVSNRLLSPMCAGYEDHVEGDGDASSHRRQQRQWQGDLLRSFDDGVGWLFAYTGEALRNPFAPPPPTEVAVMKGSRLCVSVTEWIEVRYLRSSPNRVCLRAQLFPCFLCACLFFCRFENRFIIVITVRAGVEGSRSQLLRL